jgi:hypothetical protein
VTDALNLRNPAYRDEEWIKTGYQRNINDRSTWAIRKIVELALKELGRLRSDRERMFARCLILRTAQWALDCRKVVPSAEKFRSQLLAFLEEMTLGSEQFERACEQRAAGPVSEALCLHQSAETLDSTYGRLAWQPPRLILTSPPYPGVHVVYHRWQIFGRRETPAPFWIAGTRDGAGASFYTFGDRHQSGLSDYFDTAFEAFKSIRRISDKRTTVAQIVAFSEPRWQLARYLQVMREAGFEEIQNGASVTAKGRTWRLVPNRKWYAGKQGRTASSSEVILFHRLTN